MMKTPDFRLLKLELEELQQLQRQLEAGGSWQTAALRRKLSASADRLAACLWEVAKLVEGIADPELRLIFELRYFRGLCWREVAARLPTDLSPDAARMKHNRYLNTAVGSSGESPSHNS